MIFEKRSEIPTSANELFDWHSRPGAFARLTPPWQEVEVLREDEGLDVGKRVEVKMGTPIGKRKWIALHSSCMEGREFTDTQEKGPFKSWKHRHVFTPKGDDASELLDSIEFELPLGGLGKGYIENQLEKSFAYRHWITKRDLSIRQALPNFRPLRIAITGGSGFLGSALRSMLSAQGHDVSVITRRNSSKQEIRWDPAKGEIESSRIEGLDAVINLAGENLTSGRWTDERKKRILSSRVEGTKLLVDTFHKLDDPPKVFLSGSASGIYGSDPEAVFDEGSPAGEGFLADVCKAWEEAAMGADSSQVRVCLLRTGLVIDPRGGALGKMLPAFRFGMGGPLGSGQQWFPWVSLEDWIGGVNWLLFHEDARGPYNLVGPQTVRQIEFARRLGQQLKRPAVLPLPRLALELVLGEMADEALLSSAKVVPLKLRKLGYPFADDDLKHLLGRVL